MRRNVQTKTTLHHEGLCYMNKLGSNVRTDIWYYNLHVMSEKGWQASEVASSEGEEEGNGKLYRLNVR